MSIVLYPKVSEKSYATAMRDNAYVFNVPLEANKHEISDTICKLYSVKVTNVNIVRMVGKTKRIVKKGGRQSYGKRIDYKKAYVTLAKGESIPVFAAEKESEDK